MYVEIIVEWLAVERHGKLKPDTLDLLTAGPGFRQDFDSLKEHVHEIALIFFGPYIETVYDRPEYTEHTFRRYSPFLGVPDPTFQFLDPAVQGGDVPVDLHQDFLQVVVHHVILVAVCVQVPDLAEQPSFLLGLPFPLGQKSVPLFGQLIQVLRLPDGCNGILVELDAAQRTFSDGDHFLVQSLLPDVMPVRAGRVSAALGIFA